jgi:hypothetical protein
MSRFIRNRTWGCHKCRKQWLEDFYDIELHAIGKLLCPQCKHSCCEDCAIEGLEDRLLSEPDLIDGLVDTESDSTSQEKYFPNYEIRSSSPNASLKRKREQPLGSASTQVLNPASEKMIKKNKNKVAEKNKKMAEKNKKVATPPLKKQVATQTEAVIAQVETPSPLRRSDRIRKSPISFTMSKFRHQWHAKL